MDPRPTRFLSPMSPPARRLRLRLRRGGAAGYSLVEVMVVVAMIGVLGALAITSYKKFVDWAQVADTKDIVNAIGLGQAAYHADTKGYLDCSTGWTDPSLYPMPPNGRKHHFHKPPPGGHADYACWRLLSPETTELTYMSFWTRADAPGVPFEDLPPGMARTQVGIPAADYAARPWYITVAVGDQDEDGVRSFFMANSEQPAQIHVENEDE